MTPYQVLVVDDSAFMRKIISDFIGQHHEFSVVATASTGKEALELIRQLKPDVITMDLEMPEMNGLEALRRIMEIQPTPVIMLSGISDAGTRETIKALQLGAFDFIRKPSNAVSVDKVGRLLQEKLMMAVMSGRKYKAPVKMEISVKEPPKKEPPKKEPPKSRIDPDGNPERPTALKGVKNQSIYFRDLVAVGASTGGPRALHELITALPDDFPAPVLVVQHMPPKFTHSLAQRLNTFSKVYVKEAVQGERVKAGVVYIAPGGYHMELAKLEGSYFIRLTDQEPRHGHRPSVDVLFESLLSFKELKRHTVIMTGMGSDGARAMKMLADQGIESAIAESEETCVVYGMPRSAIERGGVKTVLPLQHIASQLVQAVVGKT